MTNKDYIFIKVLLIIQNLQVFSFFNIHMNLSILRVSKILFVYIVLFEGKKG